MRRCHRGFTEPVAACSGSRSPSTSTASSRAARPSPPSAPPRSASAPSASSDRLGACMQMGGGIDGGLTGPAGRPGAARWRVRGGRSRRRGRARSRSTRPRGGAGGLPGGGRSLPDVADASQPPAPNLAESDADDDWLTLTDANDPAEHNRAFRTRGSRPKSAGGGGGLPPRGGSGDGGRRPTMAGRAARSHRSACRPRRRRRGAGGGAAGSAALLAAVASRTGRAGRQPPVFAAHVHRTGATPPAPARTIQRRRARVDGRHSALAASGGATVRRLRRLDAQCDRRRPGAACRSPTSRSTCSTSPDGVTLFPGVEQVGHVATTVVLDAQVSGATVSSYNWDTTGLTGATGISGTSTYQLTFDWERTTPPHSAEHGHASVTDTSSHIETYTYDFD